MRTLTERQTLVAVFSFVYVALLVIIHPVHAQQSSFLINSFVTGAISFTTFNTLPGIRTAPSTGQSHFFPITGTGKASRTVLKSSLPFSTGRFWSLTVQIGGIMTNSDSGNFSMNSHEPHWSMAIAALAVGTAFFSLWLWLCRGGSFSECRRILPHIVEARL